MRHELSSGAFGASASCFDATTIGFRILCLRVLSRATGRTRSGPVEAVPGCLSAGRPPCHGKSGRGGGGDLTPPLTRRRDEADKKPMRTLRLFAVIAIGF